MADIDCVGEYVPVRLSVGVLSPVVDTVMVMEPVRVNASEGEPLDGVTDADTLTLGVRDIDKVPDFVKEGETVPEKDALLAEGFHVLVGAIEGTVLEGVWEVVGESDIEPQVVMESVGVAEPGVPEPKGVPEVLWDTVTDKDCVPVALSEGLKKEPEIVGELLIEYVTEGVIL